MLEELLKLNLQMFAEDDEEEEEIEDQTDEDEEEEEEEKGEKGKQFTAKEVSKMIDDRLERERKAAKKRQQSEEEAKRLEGMSEDQKIKEKLKTLEQELAEAKRERTTSAMAKQVTNMLISAKVPVKESVVTGLIRETAEETKTSVDEFVAAVEEIKKELLKEQYTGKSPKVKKTSEQTNDEWTKDKIMKVKDSAKRQALIASHPDLFSLNKK